MAEAIVTDAIIFDTIEIVEGKPAPKYVFTHNAMWDTGSEVTIVTQEIVDSLGLKPTGLGGIFGIGGDSTGRTYLIQLGLPNGDVVNNVIAYCSEIPDYDILIGMDVICKLDFLITNNPTTTFSFRYPSQGDVELK